MTVQEYFTALASCGAGVEATPWSVADAMTACVSWLKEARDGKHTVHLMGNGGSDKVVEHAQIDLVKACGIRAMAHPNNTGMVTAYANDCGYEQSLILPLGVWLEPDDVVIAVSSSGMSPNVVLASKAALQTGARLITFSGFHPSNHLRQLGHVNFWVPKNHYGLVEQTHGTLLHYLTDELAKSHA